MKLSSISKLAVLGIVVAGLAACSSVEAPDSQDKAGTSTATTGAGQVQTTPVVDNQFGFIADSTLTNEQLLQLRTYFFKFNSTDLEGVNKQAVDAQGTYLSTQPQQKVLLAGNTDIQGSLEYNIALGYRRSKAVSQELMAQGATAKQMELVSFGPECPANATTTSSTMTPDQLQAAYQSNRRVQLIYCTGDSCQSAYQQTNCGKILRGGVK